MILTKKEILEKSKTWGLYFISLLYISMNAYLIKRDIYWGLLLPVAFILLYLYIFKLDIVLLLITFATPLAINLTNSEFGVAISFPTEPMMFGILILFLIKLLYEHAFDRVILRHPLTLLIILSLLWIFVTSMTSQLPSFPLNFSCHGYGLLSPFTSWPFTCSETSKM